VKNKETRFTGQPKHHTIPKKIRSFEMRPAGYVCLRQYYSEEGNAEGGLSASQ